MRRTTVRGRSGGPVVCNHANAEVKTAGRGPDEWLAEPEAARANAAACFTTTAVSTTAQAMPIGMNIPMSPLQAMAIMTATARIMITAATRKATLRRRSNTAPSIGRSSSLEDRGRDSIRLTEAPELSRR